jgi:hypothetical protein
MLPWTSHLPTLPVLHANDETSPTCLSDLPHGPGAVRNLLRHYFGCIEIHQRDGFLDVATNNQFWEAKTDIEFENIRTSSGITQEEDVLRLVREEAEKRVKKAIYSLAVNIEAEYRRIRVLRAALREQSTPFQDSTTPTHNLVTCVETSRQLWRESTEYTNNIRGVRRWRMEKGLYVDPPFATARIEDELECGRANIQEIVHELRGYAPVDDATAKYDLEQDVSIYMVQYTRDRHRGSFVDPDMRYRPLIPFEETSDDFRFKGKFPNQRVSLGLLLGATNDDEHIGWSDNLSKTACDRKDPTRVRYIHIPANNMEVSTLHSPTQSNNADAPQWVEVRLLCRNPELNAGLTLPQDVIARYYDEKNPKLGVHHPGTPVRTKTEMLLRPELWRGQQHGSKSNAVHARYMRPLCERVSSGKPFISKPNLHGDY